MGTKRRTGQAGGAANCVGERPTQQALVRSLLRWYDAHKRDLPWRRTRDPYAIWVSEVMLQQTQVQTVIPYYERFLARFPTLAALAAADEGDVLALWSGLGYYRRARLLHRGVRDVRAQYGGDIPRDVGSLRTLTGIGRYTAGAISSIAFGQAAPLVDGNVARVLSRVYVIRHALGTAGSERELWARAEELVQWQRPGDLNQALMELGATICVPKAPRCTACPLRAQCGAFACGEVEALPAPKARTAVKKVAWSAVVALAPRRVWRHADDPELWLVRQEGELFGALWQLPTVPVAARRSTVCTLLADLGLQGDVGRARSDRLSHRLSHRDMTISLWRANDVRGRLSATTRRIALSQLDSVGTSSLTRKLIAAAQLLPQSDTCNSP